MRSGGLRFRCSNRSRIWSFLPFLMHRYQRLSFLLILVVPVFNLKLLRLLQIFYWDLLFVLSYIKFEFRNISRHLIIVGSRTLYFFFLRLLLHLQLLIYTGCQIVRRLHFFCHNPWWKLKLLQLHLFYNWWLFTRRSRSILL